MSDTLPLVVLVNGRQRQRERGRRRRAAGPPPRPARRRAHLRQVPRAADHRRTRPRGRPAADDVALLPALGALLPASHWNDGGRNGNGAPQRDTSPAGILPDVVVPLDDEQREHLQKFGATRRPCRGARRRPTPRSRATGWTRSSPARLELLEGQLVLHDPRSAASRPSTASPARLCSSSASTPPATTRPRRVLRAPREVLSNEVATQYDLHAAFGGVVPEIASRAHAERITWVIEQALEQAGVTLARPRRRRGDAPARTRRLARWSAWRRRRPSRSRAGIPLVGVDHIEAHVVAAMAEHADLEPPFVALVASGGHTSLYAVRSEGETSRASARRSTTPPASASTRWRCCSACRSPADRRSAGWPPTATRRAVRFPRYRAKDGSLDFSFSGLKTAVLYFLKGPGRPARRAGPRGSRRLPRRRRRVVRARRGRRARRPVAGGRARARARATS